MNIISIIKMLIMALSKPKQRIKIDTLPEGKILDIGGGGEGVISQFGHDQVIAIDTLMSEIQEARKKAPASLWMVANASKLPYQDQSIDNATAFYSCMYMPDTIKTQIFKDIHRALRPQGELWIWDTNITVKNDVFVIRLQAVIPGKTIRTVYGVKAKTQSVLTLCQQLQEAGFETDIVSDNGHWFFIKASPI